MPLFDFRCTACGRVFELLVRGDSVVRCPDCGASTADRLLAVPARPMRTGAGTNDAPHCDGPPAGGGCCGGGGCGS